MTSATKKIEAILAAKPLVSSEQDARDWAMHMKRKMAEIRGAEIGLASPTLDLETLLKLTSDLSHYIIGFQIGLEFFGQIIYEALVRDGFGGAPGTAKSEALYLIAGVAMTKNETFEVCAGEVAAAAMPLKFH